MENPMLLFIMVGTALFIYFGPTVVAYYRQHHNRAAVFVFNLLLGWTGLGWIIALVWAMCNPRTLVLEDALRDLE